MLIRLFNSEKLLGLILRLEDIMYIWSSDKCLLNPDEINSILLPLMFPIIIIYMILHYTFAIDPMKSAQIFLAILE